MSFEGIRSDLTIATEPVRDAPTVAHDTAWQAIFPPSVDEALSTLHAALDSMPETVEHVRTQTDATRGVAETAQAEYLRILPQNQPQLTTGVFYQVELLKSSAQTQTEIAGGMNLEIDEARAALHALAERFAQLQSSIALGRRYAETTTLAKQGTVNEVESFIANNV